MVNGSEANGAHAGMQHLGAARLGQGGGLLHTRLYLASCLYDYRHETESTVYATRIIKPYVALASCRRAYINISYIGIRTYGVCLASPEIMLLVLLYMYP